MISTNCVISLVGGPADGLSLKWTGGGAFLYAAKESLNEGGGLRPALYRQSPRDPSLFFFTP